jgi:hypothetical protein
MENTWCPPLSPDVSYDKDALLAAAFAPGNENEVFALSRDGNLLRWGKGNSRLESVQQIFSTSPIESGSDTVPRPGTAIFSTDARWLFVLVPTRISFDGESDELRVWHFSTETKSYKPAGPARDLSFMSDSRSVLTWNERAQHVLLVNTKQGVQSGFHVFGVTPEGVAELKDIPEELKRQEVVAAGASPDGQWLAIAAKGEVALLNAANYQPKDRFDTQGLSPIAVNFGPGKDELTLLSWTGSRLLNMNSREVTRIYPHTPRDQLMLIRKVLGPGTPDQRLLATALYGRVEIARAIDVARDNKGAFAEPIVVRGATAVPQFSRSGRRILTLSGSGMNVLDTLRVSDVSMVNDTRRTPVANFKPTPGPIWLADLAAAMSALDAANDGSLLTLEQVRENRETNEKRKAAGPYDIVWKRFFPDEPGAH